MSLKDPGRHISKLLTEPSVQLLLIIISGLLAYSNTFNASFHWDDVVFIRDNPLIKHLGYFLSPASASGSEFYAALKSRYLGFLTFALNYRLGGTSVLGYHVFNLLVHLLNGSLLYILLLLTFKTPVLEDSYLSSRARPIAFFTALLFVCHPVETEAVTYIFQRLASLVALFYLGSLTFYAASRLSKKGAVKNSLYILSLVLAVCAMKTKENAFTLPAVIALYEFFFFKGPVKGRLIRLLPLSLTMLIVPLTLAGIDRPPGEVIMGMAQAARGDVQMDRWSYLFTQFRVIITYIRLLFLPAGQDLDYDYTTFRSFFDPQVLISFLFLAGLFGLGIYLLAKSKRRPDLRLPGFGIFWFFITLSVESSIIPIPMLIDEYRVYLPSMGALAAIVSGAFLLEKGFTGARRIAKPVFIVLAAVLAIATFHRNSVWKTEISLWKDTAAKSPGKASVHDALGHAYAEKGMLGQAIGEFETAARQNPASMTIYTDLASAYLSAGKTDSALEYFVSALNFAPDSRNALFNLHYNLGIAYLQKGLLDKALYQLQLAISEKPDSAAARNNLGIAYMAASSIDQAIAQFEAAISIDPNLVYPYFNLGLIYERKGMYDNALRDFQAALSIEPRYAEAYYQIGLVYMAQKRPDEAARSFQNALMLNPSHEGAHMSLGLLLLQEGDKKDAKTEFEMVIRLDPSNNQARRLLAGV